MSQNTKRRLAIWVICALGFGMMCLATTWFRSGGAHAEDIEEVTYASDDASDPAYTDTETWEEGDNGGYGFDPWVLRAVPDEGVAEFFLGSGTSATDPDLNRIGCGEDLNAWGILTLGEGFNQAVAFRAFADGGSLQVDRSFSIFVEHGDVAPDGAVGVALRNGNANEDVIDLFAGSRFTLTYVGGTDNYLLIDAETVDTGVAFTDAGVRFVFTLLSADSYDLEIRSASDGALLAAFTDRPPGRRGRRRHQQFRTL